MVAHSRAWAIWTWQPPIIEPSDLPVFTLVDYQARSGGHWAHVTCPIRECDDKAFSFAEMQTKLSGWIVKVGSPRFFDGVWNWVLIR